MTRLSLIQTTEFCVRRTIAEQKKIRHIYHTFVNRHIHHFIVGFYFHLKVQFRIDLIHRLKSFVDQINTGQHIHHFEVSNICVLCRNY